MPSARGACAQALPGGYTVGDKVFYTGANETFPSGDKLEHGQQGEVVGPGPSAALEIHKSVSVLFPGNKGTIGCYLETVRRLRAATAATSSGPAPRLNWTRRVYY